MDSAVQSLDLLYMHIIVCVCVHMHADCFHPHAADRLITPTGMFLPWHSILATTSNVHIYNNVFVSLIFHMGMVRVIHAVNKIIQSRANIIHMQCYRATTYWTADYTHYQELSLFSTCIYQLHYRQDSLSW